MIAHIRKERLSSSITSEVFERGAILPAPGLDLIDLTSYIFL